MDPVLFLLAVMLGTIVLGPILGAESRPEWLRLDRRSRYRMVGSMRPSEWDRDDIR